MRSEFFIRFGDDGTPVHEFFCPGRVNIIGDHIDYNGGLVLPAAVDMGITLLIRPRVDGKLRLQSGDFEAVFSFSVNDNFQYIPENTWANYVVGCIGFLQKKGINISGADMFYYSNLPAGSGLSSSAALEVLTLFALHNLFGKDEYPLQQIALDAKAVENTFIGVSCGIMDQFAVAMGKENHAIQLNCDTLEYEYVPVDFGEYSLIIINTNKPRSLIHSAYNQRLQECREALAIINQNHSYKNLCEVPLAIAEAELADGVLLARATHCITEHQRVITACNALKQVDIVLFAEQLRLSHISLKNNYAVSGPELDTLYDLALYADGCIGARMTGAGFGGCAIALVNTAQTEVFKQSIADGYKSVTGLTPSFYECKISSGVRKVA